MVTRYIELRKTAAKGSESTAADVMRHLHTRQHLGKALIITAQPANMLAAGRKQWMKITRSLQKQRASTLNADKILKHTHTIAHMQHMRFTTQNALESPEADVYFMDPDNIQMIPVHCWGVYIMDGITAPSAESLLNQLPAECLIIDYTHHLKWIQDYGLRPKDALEAQVDTEWRQVVSFLHAYDINIVTLADEDTQTVDDMDVALDTLLNYSQRFVQIANEFQRTLELARPLRIPKKLREQYDAVMLLAHRVQALSPGAFTHHFLETYNEDDTFFLYDIGRELRGIEPVEIYSYHTNAGRPRLAEALQAYYSSNAYKKLASATAGTCSRATLDY